jgi:hypothetical protein
MSIPEFQGNETGIYEDPRDNYFYEHYYDPSLQYLLWISEWKKHHWEIHEGCKITNPEYSQSDDYVRGFLDAVPHHHNQTLDDIFSPKYNGEREVPGLMNNSDNRNDV